MNAAVAYYLAFVAVLVVGAAIELLDRREFLRRHREAMREVDEAVAAKWGRRP